MPCPAGAKRSSRADKAGGSYVSHSQVDYSLTPLGETLIDPLAVLCEWAENHVQELNPAKVPASETQGM